MILLTELKMLSKLSKGFTFVIVLLFPFTTKGQSADHYFHSGANMFINGKDQIASNIVNEGLSKYPKDPNLIALKEKLKKDNKDQNQDQEKKDEQNKEQEQQDKKEQEQKDQEKQDQEQKDQEKKDGEKDENKDKKEQEQKDQEQQEGEKSEEEKKEEPTPSPSDKLKEMNISEEKAQMILEAMKNNEIQYIQQNKRKASKKKDSDKPDW